jgi:uncharacterized repeat protein (TIGR03803 family)
MKTGHWIYFSMVLLAVALLRATSPGQTFSVLYSFKGKPDGNAPSAGVTLDSYGNLYGTTLEGGDSDCGTVFQIDPSGTETVLYSFPCDDFMHPESGLILDGAGDIFGTSYGNWEIPYGGVFKLDRAHGKVALHHFTANGGHNPIGGVVRDPDGNVYGTTSLAGGESRGTVFKLSPSGKETVLYDFTGNADPAAAAGPLVLDRNGNLFGTSLEGGRFFYGTVFKLDPQGLLTILHDFAANGNGAIWPESGLVMDQSGTLYGTTLTGGDFGQGTIFKIDPAGNYSVLHSFSRNEWPNPAAGLCLGKNGNLYGITNSWDSARATVFEANVNGAFRIVHRFTGTDGISPRGALYRDGAGNLYGTTKFGGVYGAGTVFKITF